MNLRLLFLGLGAASSVASAQGAGGANVPRASYIQAMDQEFGKMDADKNGRVGLVEHRAGKLRSFDHIDSDKDGIVTAAEMKAAGVIK